MVELGAAFLSATCGLDNSSRLDDASAYLAAWLKALRDDKKLLLQAAGAAQKAADFILGKAEEPAEDGRAAASGQKRGRSPRFSGRAATGLLSLPSPPREAKASLAMNHVAGARIFRAPSIYIM